MDVVWYLPIYPCLNDEYDQHLLQRLRKSKNVTMRNDPDGRSRLNVNVFTGDVIVTDFGMKMVHILIYKRIN